MSNVVCIGKTKQPTFTVFQLIEDSYIQQQYRLNESINSPLFPGFHISLNDILPH
ncbi:hypothetical protein [Nostoc sp. 2RC]|uniref:hypothetical protein n=1 Tax=Nostoc sp. 2RC TaxID=2485484 RepID=UPI0037CA1445